LLEATRTAADYRLLLLGAMDPPRPVLLRVEREGAAIETEIWALPARAYGSFIAAMPAPLSTGTIRLGDGRTVQGFLVESAAVAGARDISSFGGWRAYLAKQPASG
jgi:allophanate hydrolase